MTEEKINVAIIGDNCTKSMELCLNSVIPIANKIIFVWGMDDEKTNNIFNISLYV